MTSDAPDTAVSGLGDGVLSVELNDSTGLDVRSDDAVVASLRFEASASALARASGAKWSFVRRRGAGIDATFEGTDRVIARYRASTLGGAVLKVTDGPSYRLRPPIVGERYKLRRGRTTIVEIRRQEDFEVRVTAAAKGEADLSLIVLLVIYALWAEASFPVMTGS